MSAASRWAGKVIVVEGLDGTGKSTLVAGLTAALGLVPLTTPGRTLRENFRGAFDDYFGVSPRARALAYAATVFREGEAARDLAREGAGVIIDRYWASSCAYATEEARSLLSGLSAQVPTVDCVLYVELDESERQRRLRSRGMTADDELSVRQASLLRERFDSVLVGRYARSVAKIGVDGLSPAFVVAKATMAIDSALATLTAPLAMASSLDAAMGTLDRRVGRLHHAIRHGRRRRDSASR